MIMVDMYLRCVTFFTWYNTNHELYLVSN